MKNSIDSRNDPVQEVVLKQSSVPQCCELWQFYILREPFQPPPHVNFVQKCQKCQIYVICKLCIPSRFLRTNEKKAYTTFSSQQNVNLTPNIKDQEIESGSI